MATKFCVVFVLFFQSGYSIIRTQSSPLILNETPLDLIWRLTGLAVQSRQHNFAPDQNYIQPGIAYPVFPPNGNPPVPNYPQNFMSQLLPHGQKVLEAMFSIAQNDDLKCVPKLLCEITSGTISPYGRQFSLPEVNMDSFLGLLSTFETTSPILLFGRAALLGYTAKGNDRSCTYAYPRCPSNPDVLLNYLNNHNGGFFRFFMGLNNQNYQTIPNQGDYNQGIYNQGVYNEGVNQQFYNQQPANLNGDNPQVLGFDGQHFGFTGRYAKSFPESRIVNQEHGHRYVEAVARPIYDDVAYRRGRFVFPSDSGRYAGDYQFESYRDERKLKFPNYQDDNSLDIQKPLPNHVPTPNIFPIRTGTGSLVLEDNNEGDYNRNNNFVRFSF